MLNFIIVTAQNGAYWQFVYDVIKNMILQIMIDLFLNFGMVYKTTKRVSVPNLKSFRPKKTEVSYPQTWLPQYKCMEIFKTLNSHNFCIFWCIYLKLAEIFQNEVIHCVKALSKKSLIQIFDDVIANHELVKSVRETDKKCNNVAN